MTAPPPIEVARAAGPAGLALLIAPAVVHRTLSRRSPAGYDVVLCDVWGVIHNGVAAFPAACDALTRFRASGGTRGADHQRAAAGRGGGARSSTS